MTHHVRLVDRARGGRLLVVVWLVWVPASEYQPSVGGLLLGGFGGSNWVRSLGGGGRRRVVGSHQQGCRSSRGTVFVDAPAIGKVTDSTSVTVQTLRRGVQNRAVSSSARASGFERP